MCLMYSNVFKQKEAGKIQRVMKRGNEEGMMKAREVESVADAARGLEEKNKKIKRWN